MGSTRLGRWFSIPEPRASQLTGMARLAALCFASAAATAEVGVVHWTQYVSDASDFSAAHPYGGEANKTFPIGECARAKSIASNPSLGYWRVYSRAQSRSMRSMRAPTARGSGPLPPRR